MPKNILIMGAAGKDFHVFNTLYKNNPDYKVIAFTATQIPNIDNRRYPPQLAGKFYPDGVPIKSERFLSSIIKENKIEEVIFSYSDVSYEYIEARKKKVEEAGSDFTLPNPEKIMLKSDKPVIAVCAVRTGCGKSQTTRRVTNILKKLNKRTVVVRHPMPYGDLVKQEVQCFQTVEDMINQNCTIEEMEEFEPHIQNGFTVYAGVNYEKILRNAEQEVDVIVWDGGNNDVPFFEPDLYIVVADPLRPGHEVSYYPGRINFERADVIVINKVDSAQERDIESIIENAKKYNRDAVVIKAKSPIFVEDPEKIRGKDVVVVEDGPTLTHGEMKFGAGMIAAKKYEAKNIIDPKPYITGSLAEAFKEYPYISNLLPALGYGKKQMQELEAVINSCPCDTVVIATPVNLAKILKLDKPTVRVTYELEEVSKPDLEEIVRNVIK